MKRSIIIYIFFSGLLTFVGCATKQIVTLPDPGQIKPLYTSWHLGMFPGPDDVISTATARVILEEGKAEAEIKKAKAEILRAYIKDPEKFKKIALEEGVISDDGRYKIVVWNTSRYRLRIGATGNPYTKLVTPQGSAKFSVPEKEFSVYAYRITKRGDVPYKDKKFYIPTPTPQVPFRGKLFAFHVTVK